MANKSKTKLLATISFIAGVTLSSLVIWVVASAAQPARAQGGGTDEAGEGDPPDSIHDDDYIRQLDHFRCYIAEQVHPSWRIITTGDQFLEGGRYVGRLLSICAPAWKYHNGYYYPQERYDLHLACYEVYPAESANQWVKYLNQFEEDRAFVSQELVFCVPSYKWEIYGPTSEATGTDTEDSGNDEFGDSPDDTADSDTSSESESDTYPNH